MRGYLNVTAELAGKPIHLGVYADDAVSVTLFDKNGATYPVITSPPKLGAPAKRVTNTVTFGQPGLYPIEILYAEIAEDAALEVSLFEGTFTDIDQAASGPTNLKTSGFKLLGAADFFQTLSGGPSFPDVAQCKQCDRRFVNQPGNNGCAPGNYCNESALCSPCDSAFMCGPTCSPCGGDTPFCSVARRTAPADERTIRACDILGPLVDIDGPGDLRLPGWAMPASSRWYLSP